MPVEVSIQYYSEVLSRRVKNTRDLIARVGHITLCSCCDSLKNEIEAAVNLEL